MRIVASAGGKGGVGKTVVATHLAVAAANAGQRTLLFDADIGTANADVVLGVRPRRTLADVVADRCSIEMAVTETRPNLDLLPGGSGAADLLDMSPDALHAVARDLDQMSRRYDLLVIDTGAGVRRDILRFLALSHDVLLVVSPHPTSMIDSYALVKNLDRRTPNTRLWLVASMVRNPVQGHRVFATMRDVVDKHLQCRLQYAGEIRRDDAMDESVMRQQTVFDFAPESKAAQDVAKLAQAVLGIEVPERQTNWFQRLFAQKVA